MGKGCSYTNKGSSTLICDKYGKPKKPIYIKRKGSLILEEFQKEITVVFDDFQVM